MRAATLAATILFVIGMGVVQSNADILSVRCTTKQIGAGASLDNRAKPGIDVTVVLTEGPYVALSDDKTQTMLMPKVQQISVFDNTTNEWINLRDLTLGVSKNEIFSTLDPLHANQFSVPNSYFLLIDRNNGLFTWHSAVTDGRPVIGSCEKLEPSPVPPLRPDPIKVAPPQRKF